MSTCKAQWPGGSADEWRDCSWPVTPGSDYCEMHGGSAAGGSKQSSQPPVKQIRLTIEWAGRCSEADWIVQLWDAIEDTDHSQRTRVAHAELLTEYGTTPRCSDAELDAAMVARGHEIRPPKKRPGRGFWEALWWRLRHNTRRR